MPKHDAIKVALADLVFAAVTHALKELPGAAHNPEHEPLEDVIIETVPISELELLLRVRDSGKNRYFSVKVHEDKAGFQ